MILIRDFDLKDAFWELASFSTTQYLIGLLNLNIA